MSRKYETDLRDWYRGDDSEKQATFENKGPVSYHGLALTIDDEWAFQSVLRDINWLSLPAGRSVGRYLWDGYAPAHRATQGRIIQFLVGVLSGLAENDMYQDERSSQSYEFVHWLDEQIHSDPRWADLAATIDHGRKNKRRQESPYLNG